MTGLSSQPVWTFLYWNQIETACCPAPSLVLYQHNCHESLTTEIILSRSNLSWLQLTRVPMNHRVFCYCSWISEYWWHKDILIKHCTKSAVAFILRTRKFVFEQRLCGQMAFRLLSSLEVDRFIHRNFWLQNCWQMTHHTKPRRRSNLLAGDEKKLHCERYIMYLYTHCLIVH